MAVQKPEESLPTERQIQSAKKRRKIKEVKTKLSNLTPAAASEAVSDVVAAQARRQVTGFADFLREQSVVGVGIGIVFGSQIKAVVDAIMAGFVNPVTELILPGSVGLAKQTTVWHVDGKEVELGWGKIVYSLITFVLVAMIIYAAYKLLKLDRLKKKP